MNIGIQSTPDKKNRTGAVRSSLESAALITALILSILGIGLTDYSPLKSYRYWAAMTLVLTITSLLIGWFRAKRLGLSTGKALAIQLAHWAITALAVVGIFMLLKAGRLNYENTGLVLLLVLGLSTLLDGFRLDRHFSLIGVLMLVTAVVAGFIEQYLWVLLIVALGVATVIVIREKQKALRYRSE